MLEIQLALAVEDMEMNHRMQDLASVVGMPSGDGTQDIALLIHYRKFLILIICHFFLI